MLTCAIVTDLASSTDCASKINFDKSTVFSRKELAKSAGRIWIEMHELAHEKTAAYCFGGAQVPPNR